MMKVAYHVDDEFETTDGFGILDLSVDGRNIIVSDIKIAISKIVSNGKTFIFPNRIIINKISIIQAQMIDRVEIDQNHAFFMRNTTNITIPIKSILTNVDGGCNMISFHGFDMSNAHISADSDLIKIDNALGIFPRICDSRIGLISFSFPNIFHFDSDQDNSLRLVSSLVGKVHIQNLCVGNDKSNKRNFELLALSNGTVLEILNIQYVEFHDEHSSIEINIDKISQLLNIETEDDTKVRIQR
jgi:hypothetical protein